ncbi:NACHT domain-containing protein [Amycolatopsis sp. NPDC005003]
MEDPQTSNRIVGDVGTAAQIGTVHGGVHFYASAPAPEPAPAPVAAPPRGWDDLPELPPAVQALLRAQIETARDLPYRLPGARPPSLEAVYVQQDVSGETDTGPAEANRPFPVLDNQGQLIDLPARPAPRPVVRPPSRPVRAVLDTDDHLLVTGGPGQGKSTLSLRLAADIAARWMGHEEAAPLAEPVVPLRLTARDLAARLDLPFFPALAESVQAEYGALLAFPVEPRTLAGPVAGCRWLLLVDGLDEVADLGRRDRLVKVLATWASGAASAHFRIVLTTRPIADAALAPFHGAGAARYELLPFDEDALRRFAVNWFVEEEIAERFVRQVHEANLDDLVRVPLLATIAAIMLEQYGDRPLPDNRYELYESYLSHLQSSRPVSAPWDDLRDSLLEHLGRVRLEKDTDLLSAACDWIAAERPDACATTDRRDALTTYLTAVGPFVSRGGDLQFLHHSFAEHLAATARARELPDRFEPEAGEFARLLHAACQGDRGRHARLVLLHYTRLRRAETDRLIRHLDDGNAPLHVLAARLLAWHAPASAEVTDAFLGTARAWAMTTQYPSQVILARVSRAGHHPGLAGWLQELMGDEAAPWESRIEAGRALAAQLYGPGRVDAVAMLGSVVADGTIPVEFRYEAAKALAGCGTGERATAVAGLLSVLADTTATAAHCRDAAVVLAGLGPEPRARAVEALAGLLDDPDAPLEDATEAAMGLLEIAAGYEERAAEVFRAVLGSRNGSLASLEEAALGLASLGPRHLSEAVAALKARLADHRLRGFHMFVARAMAKLGPAQRVEAGEILFASASWPGTTASLRVNIATSLAEFGPEFRERTLALLRAVATDRPANTNALLWTADTLADLGPEHHAEAAEVFNRVAGHPRAANFERTTALGKLAGLGEPHRTPAVRTLRAELADRGADPDVRVRAGRELIRLGPAFHAEAARHVLEIASDRAADPQVRTAAWRALRSLGSALRTRASSALLDLTGPAEAGAWEDCDAEGGFSEDDFDDPNAAAAAFVAVLRDPARAVRHRVAAAHNLVALGRHHHAPAVAGFIDLLRANEIPVDELARSVGGFRDVNAARQAELAEVLAAGALGPGASAELVCETAEALESLGTRDSRIDAAVLALLSDESAAGTERAAAAVLVARNDPAEFPAALTTIRGVRHDVSAVSWAGHVRELTMLGADLADDVRADVSAPDAGRWARECCAGLLAELRPELRPEALAEFRSQAADEFLTFTWRTEAVLRLAELDPSTVDNAVAFHRAVLDDEGEAVADRCEAAGQLLRLDPAQRSTAFAVLRRLAGSSRLRCAERAEAVTWLARLNLPPVELVPLARAIVHDPAASHEVRQQAARALPSRERRNVLRSVLADRVNSVDSWTATAGYWDHWSLANEVEAVLRDTLAGAETPPAERVEAAAALGRLSPRLVPQAVDLLERLEVRGHVDRLRLAALAELSPEWRVRVLADVRAALDAQDRPWQVRTEAAKFLLELAGRPLADADRDRLAGLLRDGRIAGLVRLRLLSALNRLDDLRAVRDDDRHPVAMRWIAANWLCDYGCEDRERGARVLDAIAGDSGARPPLRWRTARDLAKFGTRGRQLAATRLQALMSDGTLPVLVRVDSARALAVIRPDLRDDVQLVLRRLSATPDALIRLQVCQAIGQHDPEEAAAALRAMAGDPALAPLARLGCAQALTSLLRNQYEVAAVVARELAHDEGVPQHLREDAARGLALLSTLCRAEARDLLTGIRANRKRRDSTP